MTLSIKQVLIERDGLSDYDADIAIQEAVDELRERLEDGDLPFDLCQELFGLEEDYLIELMDRL